MSSVVKGFSAAQRPALGNVVVDDRHHQRQQEGDADQEVGNHHGQHRQRLDEPAAALQAWFGGQEMAHAIVDVLTRDSSIQLSVLDRLGMIAPVVAVHGNDDRDRRLLSGYDAPRRDEAHRCAARRDLPRAVSRRCIAE